MAARRFLCRDTLWHAFEEIAGEQGAPIDDVLCEAMRAYAEHRANAAAPPSDLTKKRPPPSVEPPPATVRAPRVLTPPPARSFGAAVPPPPQRRSSGSSSPARAAPLSRPVPPPPRSVPPPLPASHPAMPETPGTGGASLTLECNGQLTLVTKHRFVLGRSKAQADLVLKDPNVSRQHAAIERIGNDWILVDLGSTNGCYVGGERVSRRRLADGDVIEIAEGNVRCSLR